MTNDRSDFTQGNILKKLVSFMMTFLLWEGLALLPDFLQFLQAARS